MKAGAGARLLDRIRRLAPLGDRSATRLRSPVLAHETVITLRLSVSEGDSALEQLVQLSGEELPLGPSLVAEVDGEARAALSLEGGPLLIDPFHPSAELGSLLALRLAQLEASTARAQRLRVA
jgi:hypothetical protein